MVNLENLDIIIDNLQKTKDIFTKNPNRIFKSEYILQKISLKNKLKSKFYEYFRTFEDPLDKNKLEEKKIKFETIYNKLEIILNKLSENIVKSSILKDNTEDCFDDNKPINMEFDMSNHGKIVPEFDGTSQKYTNFINLVEFVHNNLNENGKSNFVNFIFKTKLSDSVRIKLSTYPVPQTLNQFKENLSKIVRSNRTALNVQSELSRLKQNNNNILDFSNKIECLIAELNTIQISQRGEQFREIIIQMNDEIGLNAFKTGINDKIRPTVVAGRPTSLNDAITLALDSEIPQEEAKILYSKSKYSGKNNKKKNFENKNNQDNNHSYKGKFCKYCKKKGHEIKECYKKKNADAKKAQQSKASGNEQAPEGSGRKSQ